MKQIQKGFTLIELMIVVAIIGILAAVAIPAYQDYVIKAKLSKVQSTIAPIKTALVIYYQENGEFLQATVTGSGASAFWTSIGLPNGVTLPDEVVPGTFTVDGTVGTGTQVDITMELQGIKASTINTLNLVVRGEASGTAVAWNCLTASTTITEPLALKYFGCN